MFSIPAVGVVQQHCKKLLQSYIIGMSVRFELLRAQEVPKCQVCKTCFQLYCCLCRPVTLQQLPFNSTRSAKTKNAAIPSFSIAAACVV